MLKRNNFAFLKSLAILLVVLLSVFLFRVISDRVSSISTTPTVPTDTPEASFTVDIPKKALWQNYFHVSAEAPPGTTCDLLYVPPKGQSQEMPSVADEDGKCTWRWKIEESQGKGNGRLILTIDGKSETHFFEIRSSF